MGKRLPPGEAERRAAERKRATFAGENYKKYDPSVSGYGSYAEWTSAAAAFAQGDIEYVLEIETNVPPSAKPEPQKARRPANPFLDMFGLDELPMDAKTFQSAYRKTVMTAFRNAGSKDTAPEYVKAFMELTKAFDRYKMQRGW